MTSTFHGTDAAGKGVHGSRALQAILMLALAGTAVARPDLYSNGPFVTTPGGGANGGNLSAVQSILFNSTQGASNQMAPAADRVADDFRLTTGATLSSVVVYGFQTNSTTATSPFTSLNLRIWSGRPGDPGAQVLFGNTTTNRLVSATWTGCYRARDDSPTNAQRPIYALEATISPPLVVPAGTYWLDWQVAGALSSGPYAAFVTLPGQQGASGANSRWKGGAASNWIDIVDGGNFAPQELAFIVRGTAGGGPAPCYANCDGSLASPVLNANDFQCFLNKFAAADSYANCDGSTAAPILNANDFQCYLNRYAGGCT